MVIGEDYLTGAVTWAVTDKPSLLRRDPEEQIPHPAPNLSHSCSSLLATGHIQLKVRFKIACWSAPQSPFQSQEQDGQTRRAIVRDNRKQLAQTLSYSHLTDKKTRALRAGVTCRKSSAQCLGLQQK